MTITDPRLETAHPRTGLDRPLYRRGRTVVPPSQRSGKNSWDRSEWISHAQCREDSHDNLFVQGSAQRMAALRCRSCPVMMQCRADALDHRVEFGIWGGMTERERRALLRNYPDVPSWRDIIDPETRAHALRENKGDAREAYEALKYVNSIAERRARKVQASFVQQYKQFTGRLEHELKDSTFEDNSEAATLHYLEKLREFEERISPNSVH